MRRRTVSALVLVMTWLFLLLPGHSSANGRDFVTLGLLPEITNAETLVVRGTAPMGAVIQILINGKLIGRYQARTNMDVFLGSVPLVEGENHIEVRLEAGQAVATATVVRQPPEKKEWNEKVPEASPPAKAVKAVKAAKFKDLGGPWSWAMADIEELVDAGVVNGMGNELFGPELSLTRAQFAKMIVLGLDLPLESGEVLTFTDTQTIPDWALTFVATAVKYELIRGYTDNTFRPDASVSRAEVAVIASRGLKHKGTGPSSKGRAFRDEQAIPEWARADIDNVVSAGLIEEFWGDDFRANEPANRAEAAAVIRRLRSVPAANKQ